MIPQAPLTTAESTVQFPNTSCWQAGKWRRNVLECQMVIDVQTVRVQMFRAATGAECKTISDVNTATRPCMRQRSRKAGGVLPHTYLDAGSSRYCFA